LCNSFQYSTYVNITIYPPVQQLYADKIILNYFLNPEGAVEGFAQWTGIQRLGKIILQIFCYALNFGRRRKDCR
jgi:hypothetical protein